MDYDRSKITIIIPTKNEGEGIERILESVKQYGDEIIVVDGHSEDTTKEIVERMGATFLLDHGLGRGDGVRVGIEAAHGEILVFFDADGSHEADDIPQLIIPILRDEADLVLSSRRTGGSLDVHLNFSGVVRSAGCDFLVSMVNHRFQTHLTDILYSFRAIRKSTAENIHLQSNDFCIEQEMVVRSLKKGYRVIEIPSREKARGWGVSKLHTLTGIKFIFQLLKECYLS